MPKMDTWSRKGVPGPGRGSDFGHKKAPVKTGAGAWLMGGINPPLVLSAELYQKKAGIPLPGMS
jgi:hypothetical protein